MNIEFLNLLKSPEEGDKSRKEKNRGHEPIWAIIHTLMKKSLYSYLKQTKMTFFQKTENRKVKQVLSGGWYQWKGEGYKEKL
jgi:hypothetical protein